MTRKILLGPYNGTLYDYPFTYPNDFSSLNEWDEEVYFRHKDSSKNVSTLNIDKQAWPGKQEEYTNKFKHTMKTGDVEPSYYMSDFSRMHNSSGEYMTFTDHYSSDRSCHAYNATWGVHDYTASNIEFCKGVVIGFKFEVNMGYGSGPGSNLVINEFVIHYRKADSTSKFKSKQINPMGKPEGHLGIKFRNSYESGTSHDVSYGQFGDYYKELNCWHTDRDVSVMDTNWRMCGVSISLWMKNAGGGDQTYKPKFRKMTPVFGTDSRTSAGMANTARHIYPGPVSTNAQYWNNTMGIATKKV